MLISDDDYSRVQSSLCDMMYAICDHAHDRCVKVIVARSKVSIIYCMLSVIIAHDQCVKVIVARSKVSFILCLLSEIMHMMMCQGHSCKVKG